MTRSEGPLERYVEYTIKRNLTRITLNIYQSNLITKITKGFNDNLR